MKRFVFLDLDDTIFDFHKAERIALSKTLETLGLQPEPAVLARYSEINAEQWRLLERGELSREEVKERRYRLLFEEFGMEISPVLTARTYERNLSIGHYFVEASGSSSVSIGKPYERKKVLDCLTCGGDGDCPKCNGYGTQENYAGAGDYVTSVCSTCHGSRTCRTCGGSGKR